MAQRVVFRSLNSHVFLFYCIALSILSITCNAQLTLNNLIGGFNAIGSINVFELIRWIFSVIPPVVVSVLLASEEFGSICIFTLIRSRTSIQWIIPRLLSVVLANITYFLLVFFICVLSSTSQNNAWKDIIFLGLQFSSHTTMVSLISITVATLYKAPSAALLSFFFIEGMTVVIGSVIPKYSKYMIAFWGMAQNKNYLFAHREIHFFVTQSITIMICILLCVITVVYLSKHNPAGSITHYRR